MKLKELFTQYENSIEYVPDIESEDDIEDVLLYKSIREYNDEMMKIIYSLRPIYNQNNT